MSKEEYGTELWDRLATQFNYLRWRLKLARNAAVRPIVLLKEPHRPCLVLWDYLASRSRRESGGKERGRKPAAQSSAIHWGPEGCAGAV